MFQDSALNPNIAWFAVLLMGLLMLLQSVVIFILCTQVGKQLRASQSVLSSLLARVESATASLRQLLSHMERVPAKLAEVEGQTPQLLVSLKDLVGSLDAALANFADKSRSCLHQFDKAADTVLSSFSTQTFRVHRAIVHPAIRFSTLLLPINDFASRLFRSDGPPASHSSDQEIFI